ncbi:hypothetical protein HRbin39_01514 [bacterium HR39]|nr:hypothetical protein HRbin39_01514 [bacterium HR39]
MKRDPRPDPQQVLGFAVALARAFLLVERLWPRLWPPLSVLGLFLLVSLFDLWRHLPAVLHIALLVLFAAAFGWTLVRALRGLRLPSREEALARIERDSGFRHQPLRLLTDRLAAGADDPLARTLWERERARVRNLVERVRLQLPRSGLPRRDPWALRALLGLLLIVGLVSARGDVAGRLAAAFSPAVASATAAPPRLEVWVSPPAYTRLAPERHVVEGGELTLDALAGSELVLQLHDAGPAAAEVRGPGSAGPLPFGELAGGTLEARTKAEESGTLEVALGGRPLARIVLSVRPDRPPEVAFAGPVEITLRRSLDVRIEARDDFGVAELALLVEPPEGTDPEEAGGQAERRVLVRPARQPLRVETRAFLDLTAHPRAGLPVVLRLEAADAAGNRGTSGPLAMVLPEREFRHPLARRIVELRRSLVEDPRRWALVALELQALGHSDAAAQLGAPVPLAIFVSSARLLQDRTPEGRRGAVDLMWETALLIEEGALAIAERRLREAEEALRRALEEGAEAQELQRLMGEFREALQRYLDELQRRLAEQMREQLRQGDRTPRDLPLDPQRMLTREDIERMAEEARRLAESGMREQARQMLEQLRAMLENLQTAVPQLRPSPAEQALSDLEELIRRQQELMDRTFRMRRGNPPLEGPQVGREGTEDRRGGARREGEGGTTPEELARRQEALRRALGELMRRLGEQGLRLPGELGRAELEMRRARDALQEGRPGEALDPQGRALEFLRGSGQAMLEQLRQQMGAGRRPGGRPGQGMPGPTGRDPFGRALRNEGGFATDGVRVPTEHDFGRAREILEELLRRSADPRRPAYERRYYERLLDRF